MPAEDFFPLGLEVRGADLSSLSMQNPLSPVHLALDLPALDVQG